MIREADRAAGDTTQAVRSAAGASRANSLDLLGTADGAACVTATLRAEADHFLAALHRNQESGKSRVTFRQDPETPARAMAGGRLPNRAVRASLPA